MSYLRLRQDSSNVINELEEGLKAIVAPELEFYL